MMKVQCFVKAFEALAVMVSVKTNVCPRDGGLSGNRHTTDRDGHLHRSIERSKGTRPCIYNYIQLKVVCSGVNRWIG